MISLASGLIALAGVFAERSLTLVRRAGTVERFGATAIAPRPTLRMPDRFSLAAAGGVLVILFSRGVVWSVMAALAAVLVRSGARRRERRRSGTRREEQLVEASAAVAAGLRAGLSLPQALAYARDESEPPLRDDLGGLIGRLELGVPLRSALVAWADQMGSEDARLIAGVLDLHRRSGGDLPAVLDGVVSTLRERRASHREIRALTAQARLSGGILGALPVGFFGFLLLTARRDMLAAIATPIGATAIAVGLGLEGAAFIWIRRLLAVQ